MDAILLVGGFGTRLLPLTRTIPKPLIPLANVPFVERTVHWLRDAGVDHVILSLHYNPEQFEAHFKPLTLGVDISFAIEAAPLGTGGAIKNCEPYLRSERCFIFNGDIFTSLNLLEMLANHQLAGAAVSIATIEVEDPSRYGVIETSAQGRILSFTEKPPRELAPSRDINAGAYIFNREAFDWFPQGPCSVEKDTFPRMLKEGLHLQGYHEPMYWTDLGTPGDYLQAHRDILARKVEVPIHCHEIKPGVWAGSQVVMDEQAHVIAPSLLGDGVRIGCQAVVGPSVALGHGVQIGDGAWVQDSVIWDNAHIGANSRVSGSVIGRRAYIDGTASDTVCEDDGVIMRKAA
ncbi:MAG: sugar phosphate nucleotidyltransferase [Armatimonadota bacterium]